MAGAGLGAVAAPVQALRFPPLGRPLPAQPVRGLGTAVDAGNALIALPWGGISRQYTNDAVAGIRHGLEGKVLAEARGSVGQIGARWGVKLSLAGIDPSVDLRAPPGFRASSLTGPAVDGSPGFAVEAPLGRTWSFGVRGSLVTDPFVRIAGHKICCPKVTLPFGFGLSGVRLAAAVKVDASEPDRPRLLSATLDPHLAITGGGVFPVSIPVAFQVQVVNGRLRLVGHVTNLSLGIDGLNARLTGDLVVTFRPSHVRLDTDLSADQEVLGVPLEGRVSAHVPFTVVDVAFTGGVSMDLKRVGRVSAPYSFGFALPVPSSDQINQALSSLQGPLPRSFGDGTPPPELLGPAPAGPPEALGSAAQELERQITPHLPFGAVLSLDYSSRRAAAAKARSRAGRARLGPVTRGSSTHYGLEADSSIWTGHYLAAEAFRYAATNGDAAALSRLRAVLDGIDRLFYVTGDAAAVNGSGRLSRRASDLAPVTVGPGIFARTARPSTSVRDYAPPLNRRPCHYERPARGWTLSAPRSARRHFATYREVATYLARQPALSRLATVTPVGTVWFGWGCGDDHPISRDQYLGLFMGLGIANQLVDQADIRQRTRALIDQMLDYLIRNNWNVVLPPDNRIRTMFVGNIDVQLAFLRIGATVDPGRYLTRYRRYAAAAELDWTDVWFSSLDPISSYFKFNLAHALFLPSLLYEDDPGVRSSYLQAYDLLWRTVRQHENAWFDVVHALVAPPSQRAGVLQQPSAANGGLTLGQEIQTVLEQWLVRRSRVPGPDGQPRNDLPDPQTLLSLWPNDVTPYTSLEGATSCQAKFAIPVSARTGNGMDFVWQRSPFGTSIPSSKCRGTARPTEQDLRTNGAADAQREGPAVDYLLAYWAAAYVGAVPVPAGTAVPGGGTGNQGGGGTGNGPGATARPALTRLRLEPRTFRARRSGPSASVAVGTTVRYRLSRAATATFTVLRAVPGVRRGRRCVRLHGSVHGRHRCTAFVAVRGRFVRTGPAGASHFRFSGRIGGRALAPAGYRLRTVPQAGGRRGVARLVAFRVVR